MRRYAALFAALGEAVRLLLDTGGRPVWSETDDGVDCLQLAWFGASVSRIGGAVGFGLEDQEAIRNAAHGQRQRAAAAHGRG
ncbi:hypothetical protein [Streptomyces sp. NPDC001315]|uniref:hypothetical protein n=1 Tax=Streptomyces sp. NPDC001315 TaxID=3364562 RepID=UPI0036B63FAB